MGDSCQDVGDCSEECLDVAAAALESCCDSLGDSGILPFHAIAQCKSSSQSEPVLENVLECSLPSSSSSNPFGSSSSLVGVPAVAVAFLVIGGLFRRVANGRKPPQQERSALG